jgi:hypothetical protein
LSAAAGGGLGCRTGPAGAERQRQQAGQYHQDEPPAHGGEPMVGHRPGMAVERTVAGWSSEHHGGCLLFGSCVVTLSPSETGRPAVTPGLASPARVTDQALPCLRGSLPTAALGSGRTPVVAWQATPVLHIGGTSATSPRAAGQEGRRGNVGASSAAFRLGCHSWAPCLVAEGEDGCDADDRHQEGTRV